MQDLIVDAELFALGATLVTTALIGIVGDCDFETRTIRVSKHQTPAEQRSTAMHEAGHLALNHVMTGDEALDAVMEAEADRWAAMRLIPEQSLAYAKALARDTREMAEILGVDMNILEARIAALGEPLNPPQWATVHSMVRTAKVD